MKWALLPLLAFGIFHNVPAVVEQQSPAGASCAFDGDLSDCVTNTGPCVWDPDDVLQVHEPDGAYAGCLFADWSGHDYKAIACGKKRGQWLTIAFSPGLTVTFTSEQRIGKQWCVQGQAHIEYDHEYAGYAAIPHQGGGGGLLGRAVPTTVTVTSKGSLYVHVDGCCN